MVTQHLSTWEGEVIILMVTFDQQMHHIMIQDISKTKMNTLNITLVFINNFTLDIWPDWGRLRKRKVTPLPYQFNFQWNCKRKGEGGASVCFVSDPGEPELSHRQSSEAVPKYKKCSLILSHKKYKQDNLTAKLLCLKNTTRQKRMGQCFVYDCGAKAFP